MWRPIYLGISSATPDLFLTGRTTHIFSMLLKTWHSLILLFLLRFGKPDPRNAALVSAMAVIGKAFKRLHK